MALLKIELLVFNIHAKLYHVIIPSKEWYDCEHVKHFAFTMHVCERYKNRRQCLFNGVINSKNTHVMFTGKVDNSQTIF